MAAEDWDAAGKLSHKLRGSAFMFDDVAKSTAELESALRESLDRVPERLSNLQNVVTNLLQSSEKSDDG